MSREGFCHREQKRRMYPVGWESWLPSCLTRSWKIRTLTREAELTSMGIGKACFLHRKKPKQFKVCAVYLPGLAKLGLHCASIPVLMGALQRSLLKEGLSKEMGTNRCFPSKSKREKLTF